MLTFLFFCLVAIPICGGIKGCIEEREKNKRRENFRKALAHLDANFKTEKFYDKL